MVFEFHQFPNETCYPQKSKMSGGGEPPNLTRIKLPLFWLSYMGVGHAKYFPIFASIVHIPLMT